MALAQSTSRGRGAGQRWECRDAAQGRHKRCRFLKTVPVREGAFYQQLRLVRAQPIQNSTVTVQPRLSKYALRLFQFADCKAIFEYDIPKGTIRVVECRRIKSQKHRPGGS